MGRDWALPGSFGTKTRLVYPLGQTGTQSEFWRFPPTAWAPDSHPGTSSGPMKSYPIFSVLRSVHSLSSSCSLRFGCLARCLTFCPFLRERPSSFKRPAGSSSLLLTGVILPSWAWG